MTKHYKIWKENRQIEYFLPADCFETKKKAREHLRYILNEYKDDYIKGKGVKKHCRWINADQIMVHRFYNDGTLGLKTTFTIKLEE